ncbi:MAG: PaaI family thioesterase, partial [Betaproteobacteria bacterium]
SIGVKLEEKHANSRGICHGGMLATLADLSLGYAMLAHAGGKAEFVTAHLSLDYAGAARAGDWVESQVEIQRMGSRLAFANCYLVAGGKRIVRASAIFARAEKSG